MSERTPNETVSTLDDSRGGAAPGDVVEPGLLLVFAGHAPQLRAIPLKSAVVLGRDDAGGAPVPDERMSRRHVRIEQRGGSLVVEDLGSRNGTFIDGARIEGAVERAAPRVIRAGGTVLVPVANVHPFLGATISDDGAIVAGPTLARALSDVAGAAATGETVLLRGESGAGKENAARVFHANGGNARGPLVAVNCATIPATVAERLLFGAKRGAYSGATDDAEGFCAAADGGTLFLDEVGELPLDVQAKLLRFLETREFFPLGAAKPRRVNVRVCCATHRDLREGTAAGTFRADLYYRLSTLEARIPPLRERPEEIPWLVQRAVASSARAAEAIEVHASFIESCVARSWPGNVRELFGAVRSALHAARDGKLLSAEHLEATAGIRPAPSTTPLAESGPRTRAPELSRSSETATERDRMIDALNKTGGNQTTAAALLGISRRTFIRRLEELDVPRPRMAPRC